MLASQFVDTVTRVVGPLLGENMARSAAQAHCRKLEIDGELSPEQVDTLVELLRKGLNVFVGPAQASRLAGELLNALRTEAQA